ncbi:MAG: hypothetical protein GY869_30985, partial [Planctomycetes bacterium]|nr:hypothetical protein [Planctomycetota bacterium]
AITYDNLVYDNYTGIYANVGTIRDNWVYANNIGIDARSETIVQSNRVYANTKGIRATRPYYNSFYGQVKNNLVYDNTEVGIIFNYGTANADNLPQIHNNTVYQPTGDALQIGGDSQQALIRNNILWAESGYIYQISDINQDGVDSDYNLLVTGGTGVLGTWSGVEFDNRADWFYQLGLDGHSLTEVPDFVDINGPDGVRGFSWLDLEAPLIIDNGDAGFATVGDWTPNGTTGYDSDYTASAKGSGADVATWTFMGLDPGATYLISATWPVVSGSAYDALYRVLENGEVVAARQVDQRYIPTDIQDGYGDWAHVAFVEVSGSTLEVKLDDLANNQVVADAVRIQKIAGDGGEDDDFHLQTTSDGIDAGDPWDAYDLEPTPNNGERINIGAYGNTDEAATSPTELVQVLTPFGLEKYEVGQEMRIWWNTDGLTSIRADDGSYQAAVMVDDPAAYYRLNESTLDSVTDSSGNGLNGSFNSEPVLGVAGAFGSTLDKAVQFDGQDDYITIPDDGSLTFTKEVSFSMWIKPQRLENWQTLLYKGGGTSSTRAYSMYLYSNGRIYLYSSDGSYQSLYTDTNVIQTDQWYHIAGVIDRNAGQMSIYVNGQLEATGAVRKNDMVAPAEPLHIGYDTEGNNRFQGIIDEVTVFGKALSQTNLQAHLNAHVDRVDIDLLEAHTQTWVEDIATNVEAPQYFDWEIPGSVPTDANYLVRVTAYQGGSPFGTSYEPFMITNAGTDYYINIADDTDLLDNDYTTTAGDNRNSGKSENAPMASLSALIAAYDLNPGDTVYVDTGTYSMLGNNTITWQDAGVSIQGPVTPGLEAVMNRDNTIAGSYVFELINADGITLDHLSLTGGEYGIYADALSDSEHVTVSNCWIHHNSLDGISFNTSNDQAEFDINTIANNRYGIQALGNDITITYNTIYEQSNYGIYVNGDELTVDNNVIYTNQDGMYYGGGEGTVNGNQIYGNQRYGINISTSGRVTVSENEIFDNGQRGINASSASQHGLLIAGNIVYGHDDSGDYGINIASQWVTAENNVVYGNDTGIFGSSGMIRANRIFDSTTGIDARSATMVRDNIVYSNTVGILGSKPYYNNYYGLIENNLVYANTDVGIVLNYGAISGSYHPGISNNTIYQQVGDAIRIGYLSQDVSVKNNIIWVDSGYALNVSDDSQTRFDSDYNLFYKGTANAFLAFWDSTEIETLAEWQTTVLLDIHSLVNIPEFVDINGADNILGYNSADDGFDGGLDDNFYISSDSPAIDRAYSWAGPHIDITGMPRVDDPGATNLGSDDYWETDLGGSLFAVVGAAQNWHYPNHYMTYTLPFTFPFYDVDYNSVYVSSNGFVQFDTYTGANDPTNTYEEFLSHKIIAPLWDDIKTNGTGDDIYIDTTVTDQLTIRWDASLEADDSDINVSVTLHADGKIEFHYGSGNQNLTPTVGISKGDGHSFILTAYNDIALLNGVNSIAFPLEAGIKDIGAYEYLGGDDTTPPIILNTNPEYIHLAGANLVSTDAIHVFFDEPLINRDALAPANYTLFGAGPNGTLGNIDDIEYDLVPHYIAGATTILLDIVGGDLPTDLYEFTVVGLTMRNLAGISLDGDADLTPGGNYVRRFSIDRDPPVVLDTTLQDDTGVNSDDFLTNDTTPELTITFSEEIIGAPSDIEVLDPQFNPIVPDTIIWGADTLTIGFDTPLTLNGAYNITLLAVGITDLAGHNLNGGSNELIQFTLDKIQPEVYSVVINNGQAQRSNVTQMQIRFTETMPIDTLFTAGTIDDYVKIYEQSNPAAPLAWLDETFFQWTSYNRTITIDLTEDGFGGSDMTHLANGQYEVRLDTSAFSDPAGNSLLDDDGIIDDQLVIERSTGSTSPNFFRLLCDANGDGLVNQADLDIWLANYNPLPSNYNTPAIGDWNLDTRIDGLDIALWQQNYNPTGLVPFVSVVGINVGANQRSNITDVTIKFTKDINLDTLITIGSVVDYIKVYDKSDLLTPLAWLTASHFAWDDATDILTVDLTTDGVGGSPHTQLNDSRFEIRLDTAAITDTAGNDLVDNDGLVDGYLTIDRSTASLEQDFFRLECDANGDAKVNGDDLNIWQQHYDPIPVNNNTPGMGDWNLDGKIDGLDIALWQQKYNDTELPATAPPPSSPPPTDQTSPQQDETPLDTDNESDQDHPQKGILPKPDKSNKPDKSPRKPFNTNHLKKSTSNYGSMSIDNFLLTKDDLPVPSDEPDALEPPFAPVDIDLLLDAGSTPSDEGENQISFKSTGSISPESGWIRKNRTIFGSLNPDKVSSIRGHSLETDFAFMPLPNHITPEISPYNRRVKMRKAVSGKFFFDRKQPESLSLALLSTDTIDQVFLNMK